MMPDYRSPVFTTRKQGPMLIIAFAVIGFCVTATLLNRRTCGTPSLPVEVIIHDAAKSHRDTLVVQEADSLFFLAKGGDGHGPRTTLGPHDVFLHRVPEFLMWCVLVSAMVAFAMGCLPLFWSLWQRLSKKCGISPLVGTRNALSALAIVSGLIVASLSVSAWFSVEDMAEHWHLFFQSKWDFRWPVIVTMFCAAAPIWLIFCVSSCASTMEIEDAFRPNAPKNTVLNARIWVYYEERIARTARALRACLIVLSIMIAFAVGTAGTLQLAVQSFFHVPVVPIFPVEFVHAWGVFFSAFLLIIYAPVHLHLQSVYKSIRKQAIAAGVPVGDTDQTTRTTATALLEPAAPNAAQMPLVTSKTQVLEPSSTRSLTLEQAPQAQLPSTSTPLITSVGVDLAKTAPLAEETKKSLPKGLLTKLLERLSLLGFNWSDIETLLAVLGPVISSFLPKLIEGVLN